jgi:transcriptional regulator with XRE-family HTH domain
MSTNFRNARILRGLSQKEVAHHMKVSNPTVSDWEHEKKTPTGKNLILLADLFGCSVDYLLGRTDSPLFPHTYHVNGKDVTILDTKKETPSPEEQESIEEVFRDAPEFKGTIPPELQTYIDDVVGKAVADALNRQNKD